MDVLEFFDSSEAKEEFRSCVIPTKKKKLVPEVKKMEELKIEEKDSEIRKKDVKPEIKQKYKPEPEPEEESEVESDVESEESLEEEIPVELNVERHSMASFEKNLSKINFKGSLVNNSYLEGIAIENKSYVGIYQFIYEFIGDIDKIKQNSILNIVDGKKSTNGFKYMKNLKISVQGVSADRSVKEIFNQVLKNDFTFSMEILSSPNKYIFHNE